jgi:hypothetical protein
MAEVDFLKRKYLKKAKRTPKTKLPQHDGSVHGHGYTGESYSSAVPEGNTCLNSGKEVKPLEKNDCVVLQVEGDNSINGEFDTLSTSPLTGQIIHNPKEAFTPVANTSSLLSGISRSPYTPTDTPSPACRSCEETTTQNKTLNNLLSAQRKANKELKKLLVASVGDDLKSKFSRVAEEKAQLSIELDDTLQQLTKDWEEIERLAIESDLWRTKYVASRFVIEELLQWKAALVHQVREEEKLFCLVFKERRRLEEQLQKCLMSISCAHAVFSQSLRVPASRESHLGTCRDVSSLVEALDSKSRDLYNWIGGSKCCHDNYTSSKELQPTLTEVQCQQALDRQRELLAACDQSPLLDTAHRPPSTPAANPVVPRLPSLLNTVKAFLSSREDHLKISFHCKKCKGKTIIV